MQVQNIADEETRYINSGVTSIADGGGSAAVQVPRGAKIYAVSVIFSENAPLTPVRIVLANLRLPTQYQIHLGYGWIWKNGGLTKGMVEYPNLVVPYNFGKPQPYVVGTVRNNTGSAKNVTLEALISD